MSPEINAKTWANSWKMSFDSSKTSYWTKYILKIDILVLVYEVWFDKIKASVMRYHVKGQERDSHVVLPVDELVILQSNAPNAKTQAHGHFLISRSQI